MTTDSADCFDSAVDRYLETGDPCGEGSHGIVFNGEEGQVVKLHPKTDRAYIAFIKWVNTLQNEAFKAHFPNIYHFDEHDDYVTVIMERLYHHNCLSECEQARIPSFLCPYDVGIAEAFDQAKHRFLYATDIKLHREGIRSKKWAKFKVIDSLEDAMQALLLHVHTTGFACDLHDENIMFRRQPDGSCVAVIIDPFSC